MADKKRIKKTAEELYSKLPADEKQRIIDEAYGILVGDQGDPRLNPNSSEFDRQAYFRAIEASGGWKTLIDSMRSNIDMLLAQMSFSAQQEINALTEFSKALKEENAFEYFLSIPNVARFDIVKSTKAAQDAIRPFIERNADKLRLIAGEEIDNELIQYCEIEVFKLVISPVPLVRYRAMQEKYESGLYYDELLSHSFDENGHILDSAITIAIRQAVADRNAFATAPATLEQELQKAQEAQEFFDSFFSDPALDDMTSAALQAIVQPPSKPISIKPADGPRLFSIPTSPASNLVMEVLSAGKNTNQLPERKQLINNSTEITVSSSGPRMQIVEKSGTAEITIEIADINKIAGSNKRTKKFFVYALQKMNEQMLQNGIATRDAITFTLRDLTDIHLYETRQSAAVGFDKAADGLTNLKVKGAIKKSRSSKSAAASQSSIEVLFTGAERNGNECIIYPNPRINWAMFAMYYTVLPDYYYKLSNRAADLLFYIFYIARMRTEQIKKESCFNISFRAIQQRLFLPDEKSTKNPQRDIKDEIDSAIEEIEEAHSARFGNTDLALLPIYDETDSITEYLNNGYLKISLKGEFATRFLSVHASSEKKRLEAKKRFERIAEKAAVQKLAGEMKDRDQQNDGGGN